MLKAVKVTNEHAADSEAVTTGVEDWMKRKIQMYCPIFPDLILDIFLDS